SITDKLGTVDEDGTENRDEAPLKWFYPAHSQSQKFILFSAATRTDILLDKTEFFISRNTATNEFDDQITCSTL
ncbi:hypothetical protein MKW98_026744, partial [Papaver atlanticum]